MRRNQWNRMCIAFFFQLVISLYLLSGIFQAASSAPTHAKEPSKTLLGIHPGSPVIVRAAAEQSVVSSAFVNYLRFGSLWLFAEQVFTRTLSANIALKVSSGIYNTYYILLTIHAP